MFDETKVNDTEAVSDADNKGVVGTKQEKTNVGTKRFKKKRKKSVKSIVILIAVLILIAACVLGVYMLFFKEEAKVAITDKTIYGALDRSISGSGTTTPAEILSVTAVSSAEIQEVYVSAGDTVEEGDLLYTQDDSEVDEMIADIEEKIEDYEDEITDYNSSINDTYTSISDTNDKIEDYRDQISELKETLSDMTVKAEFSGKITDIAVKEGRNVSNGGTLAVLTDDSVLEISQYYSYAYEDVVYMGMPAEVTVSGMLGTLDGYVSNISYVSWSSDEGMKCFEVTVDVENPGALTDNSTASCTLEARDGSLLYPVKDGALSYKNSETVVAPAAGELVSVNVNNHDSVYAGQVLFVIDSTSLESQIKSLEKQITSAQKQLTHYSSQIENYQKKIMTTNEKIADLYEEIDELEESREDYAMTSEISGKVMYVNIEPGDTPNTMMPVVTIYNLETMDISVNFDELDVDYVSEGTAVTITRTSAETNTFYDGVITYLSPEVLNDMVKAVYVHAPDKSSGHRVQDVDISYNHIGILPANLLYDIMNGKAA